MPVKIQSIEDYRWLQGNPGLQQLMDRFPAQWEVVGPRLVAALESAQTSDLEDFALQAKTAENHWTDRIAKSRNNPQVIDGAMPFLVQSRMVKLSLEKCLLAAATGRTSGKIRFNLLNGMIIQRLLFQKSLVRKPASLFWFSLWWPLLWQRKILMPLVQTKGIYCFYSKRLVAELAELIGDMPALEIASGDGTLSRFLAEKGVRITATDDYSWSRVVDYPPQVEKINAKKALLRYQPQAVICSWPPPGNTFERQVFATPSVDLYIVIGSRYSFASGDWKAYSEQDRFEEVADPRLSRFVLPPELESKVLVFRRKGNRGA